MSAQSTKTVAMFRVAETYTNAGLILTNHQPRHPNTIVPGIILFALALEIYFKLLLVESGKRLRGTHRLEPLFNSLTSEQRTRIKTYAQPLLSRSAAHKTAQAKKAGISIGFSDDFITALKTSNDAFVNLRYLYEGNAEGWFGEEILVATRRMILETHTDWKGIATEYKRATFQAR